MAAVKVFATWVGDDDSGRAELTRMIVEFDSSDAEVREADGDHFVVVAFPEGTHEQRALAQASEIVRGAADEAGVAQESVELVVEGGAE